MMRLGDAEHALLRDRAPRLADAGDAVVGAGLELPQRREERAGREDEHAAVPQVVAGIEVGLGGGRVGLLHELLQVLAPDLLLPLDHKQDVQRQLAAHQPLFFRLAPAFYLPLEPHREAAVTDMLREHQLEGAASAQTPRAAVILVIGQPALHIRGDARIQRAVVTADKVEMPHGF